MNHFHQEKFGSIVNAGPTFLSGISRFQNANADLIGVRNMRWTSLAPPRGGVLTIVDAQGNVEPRMPSENMWFPVLNHTAVVCSYPCGIGNVLPEHMLQVDGVAAARELRAPLLTLGPSEASEPPGPGRIRSESTLQLQSGDGSGMVMGAGRVALNCDLQITNLVPTAGVRFRLPSCDVDDVLVSQQSSETLSNKTMRSLKLSGDSSFVAPARLSNVAPPLDGSDVATKSYVDGLIQGIDFQESVRGWLAEPTGNEANGDRYIVAAPASGALAGRESQVACFQNGWTFIEPSTGQACLVEDEQLQYVFNGQSWVQLASAVRHAALSGLRGDDHPQYALLAGRAGGQELYGGLGADDELRLAGSPLGGVVRVEAPVRIGGGMTPPAGAQFAVISSQQQVSAFCGQRVQLQLRTPDVCWRVDADSRLCFTADTSLGAVAAAELDTDLLCVRKLVVGAAGAAAGNVPAGMSAAGILLQSGLSVTADTVCADLWQPRAAAFVRTGTLHVDAVRVGTHLIVEEKNDLLIGDKLRLGPVLTVNSGLVVAGPLRLNDPQICANDKVILQHSVGTTSLFGTQLTFAQDTTTPPVLTLFAAQQRVGVGMLPDATLSVRGSLKLYERQDQVSGSWADGTLTLTAATRIIDVGDEIYVNDQWVAVLSVHDQFAELNLSAPAMQITDAPLRAPLIFVKGSQPVMSLTPSLLRISPPTLLDAPLYVNTSDVNMVLQSDQASGTALAVQSRLQNVFQVDRAGCAAIGPIHDWFTVNIGAQIPSWAQQWGGLGSGALIGNTRLGTPFSAMSSAYVACDQSPVPALLQTKTGATTVSSAAGQPLKLAQGASSVCLQNGLLGVGTEDPQKTLHVAGDALVDGALVLTGSLQVNGNVSFNYTDHVRIADSLLQIAVGGSDSDIGLVGKHNNEWCGVARDSAKQAFVVFDYAAEPVNNRLAPYSLAPLWCSQTCTERVWAADRVRIDAGAPNASVMEVSPGKCTVRGSIVCDDLQTVSDERLKTCVGPADLQESLRVIRELEPILFRWNSQPDKTHLGLLAQQAQAVSADLVSDGDVKSIRLLPLIMHLLVVMGGILPPKTPLNEGHSAPQNPPGGIL